MVVNILNNWYNTVTDPSEGTVVYGYHQAVWGQGINKYKEMTGAHSFLPKSSQKSYLLPASTER